MTDLDVPVEEERPLDPDEVSSRTFATAFRGFDPVQVRAFLGTVADELRRLQEQEASLRAALEAGAAPAPEEPAPSAEAPVDPAPEAPEAPEPEVAPEAAPDTEAIVDAARAEADRLLREARERVEQLGAAATAETTRVLEEARAEAARLRSTATEDLKGRFEEAEATAVRKIAEAEREAAAIRVKAREESEATIEAARERGREMVSEAQAARERMLADLAKRKRAAQAQLEQLRAGRERLLDSLKVARRTIDEMTSRFDASDGGSASATTPPSSGTPSGPVTTTPGAAASDARPRPATANPPAAPEPDAAERPRPVRARAIALGEAPPTAARPQIAAPQAGVEASPAGAHAPGPTAAGSPEPVDVPPPAPAEPRPAPRTEERRSSALRILRRNKPAEPAPPVRRPLVGRDSSAEGVRIIGRPAEPEPEPEVAAVTAVEAPPLEPVGDGSFDDEPMPAAPEPPTSAEDAEPEPEPESEAEVETEGEVDVREVAEPVELPSSSSEPEVAAVATVEAAEGVDHAALPEPLARDEIRPKIEDLFARIRADREAATASARQVLAGDAVAPVVADDRAGEAATGGDAGRDPEPAAGAPESADADEHRLQARDAVTEPLIGQLTKRLKRALQDEQNATLDRLRTSRGRVTVDSVLSRRDDQSVPYRHLTLPFLDEAARAGAAASPFGPVPVTADDLAAQLADDLAGAVRSRLDAVLTDAASEDLDLQAMGERISAVYRDWKVQKVERLATHYLVAAHERGGFLAHPEGTPLRWIVDDDGPCPDCEDNALAGPTARGEAFPTGQLHPPAHLGCRCLLAPTPA